MLFLAVLSSEALYDTVLVSSGCLHCGWSEFVQSLQGAWESHADRARLPCPVHVQKREQRRELLDRTGTNYSLSLQRFMPLLSALSSSTSLSGHTLPVPPGLPRSSG